MVRCADILSLCGSALLTVVAAASVHSSASTLPGAYIVELSDGHVRLLDRCMAERRC